jgi:hypothetical protein
MIKVDGWLGGVAHNYNLSTREAERQEDREFEASLGCITISCLKKKFFLKSQTENICRLYNQERIHFQNNFSKVSKDHSPTQHN